jgi:hypothetical protein
VYTSSREEERAREMAARAGNPRETREPPEKSTGGTAANVYKEMQEATKSSDEMTWKGSECILIKLASEGGARVISSQLRVRDSDYSVQSEIPNRPA